MKVKILVSIAGTLFSYKPGDEPDIENKEAKRWIDAGIAEKIATKKKTAAKKPAAKEAEAKPAAPAPKKSEPEAKPAPKARKKNKPRTKGKK